MLSTVMSINYFQQQFFHGMKICVNIFKGGNPCKNFKKSIFFFYNLN